MNFATLPAFKKVLVTYHALQNALIIGYDGKKLPQTKARIARRISDLQAQHSIACSQYMASKDGAGR